MGKSTQALKEEAINQIERLESEIYVEEGHIVIKIDHEYNIALSRCDSNEKILSWVAHLCPKRWMTLPRMERFIRLAQEENGLTDPGVIAT